MYVSFREEKKKKKKCTANAALNSLSEIVDCYLLQAYTELQFLETVVSTMEPSATDQLVHCHLMIYNLELFS